MKNFIFCVWYVTFMLAVGACRQADPGKLMPRMDSAEVILIAIKEIARIHPEDAAEAVHYRTTFEDGVWTAYPNLPVGTLGGGWSAAVDDKTGKVLRTFFAE